MEDMRTLPVDACTKPSKLKSERLLAADEMWKLYTEIEDFARDVEFAGNRI